MHITKQKKPIWKGYILHDSKYMTFCKRQNYGNKKICGWVARKKRVMGEWTGQAQKSLKYFVEWKYFVW